MRFGKWRVTPLAMALVAMAGMGIQTAALADGWRLHSTLPGEVPAYDYSTGGEYFAPPVPYGHYAKDYHAEAAKAIHAPIGMLHGCLKDMWDKSVGLFHHGGGGHGNGCGGGLGHGCGGGLGKGCGGGLGHGCGGGLGHGNGCGLGNGCGFCAGRGLFAGGHGNGCGMGDGCGSVAGAKHGGLLNHLHKKNFAPCHASTVVATAQSLPSSQAVVVPSGQAACGTPGCGLGGIHSHLANLKNKLHCRLCGGKGFGAGGPCGGCGGMGLGHGCGLCGGRGCAACLKGLAGKLHGLKGHLAGLLHHQKFDWFVGPGGPVPLTPGYVPYIVTTRSPRDYFAFPPMNPDVP